MNKFYYLYLLILFTFNGISIAQLDSLIDLNEKIFFLLDEANDNWEDASYLDQIEHLISNPINLNSAKAADLLAIPFLSPISADKIIELREKRGKFKSINEIYQYGIIGEDLFLLIKSFIYVETPKSKKRKSGKRLNNIHFRSRIISNIQTSAGFKTGKYQGNKLKEYNRLKVRRDNVSLGILTEKDPGELSFADHYAGFLHYFSEDRSQEVILGDFNVEFGQGLVLWRPYSFSKGNQATLTSHNSKRTISPFLSTEENLFFRGAGGNLKFKDIDFTVFYSALNVDATVENDTIKTLGNTGYHRTILENQKKDMVRNIIYGSSLNYTVFKNLNLGILYLRNTFNRRFAENNKYLFSGNSRQHYSLSLNYKIAENYLSAEIAASRNSTAIIISSSFLLNDEIDLLISYRNYPPGYQSIYGNGFSEYGRTQNEQGFYIGVELKTIIGRFNIYFDQFSSISSSYNSIFPATGYEFLCFYNTKLQKKITLKLKMKFESKESEGIYQNSKMIINNEKWNLRAEADYKIFKSLKCRSRIEFTSVTSNGKSEYGILSMQDFKFSYDKLFSLKFRFTLFETESYDSRLYQFENDLPGVMKNSMLYGDGLRWYFLMDLRPINFLQISLKYSETLMPGLKFIGSGNSQITGSLNNTLSLQADLNF